MRRTSIAVVFLVLFALLVASCGGGPPTKMTTYEASKFTLEYPEAWQQSGMDFMGMTMAFLTESEIALEDFDMEEPPDSGLVLLMYTPTADSEFSIEDFDEEIADEEDVTITSKGDITVGGKSGKYAKAQGQIEEDGDEFGMMMVVVEDAENTFVFIGMAPDDQWAQNEKIFDYMIKTVEFK